jgi:hypothetical protein
MNSESKSRSIRVRAGGLGAAFTGLLRRERWRRRPPWPGFGEPFNGQRQRAATVDRLVERFLPDACIETGTFMGFTTRRLASFGCPVVSVEVNPGYFHLSRLSLRDLAEVEVINGDSARVLNELRGRGFQRPLLYLDAHWEERVPLADEFAVIFENWREALVVVDDFRVPHDPGYGYDIYGGVPLSLEEFDLPGAALIAYPAAPAREETGSRRGTLYVGIGAAGRDAVQAEIDRGVLVPAR